MGLGQTIMYIVIPVAIVIFMLLGDTTGYNFSLKVNFIANFFAPLLAYTLVSSVGISFMFSETKSPMLEFILIGIITLVIVYLIATISMYKAAKDKTVPGAAGKQTCQNYKMSSAMKHGIKIVIIAMATFFVVSMYPILQRPFAKLTEKLGVEDPQRIAYGIIGFYMAFMSLTSTSLAYFPALEEGCRMTDAELQNAFDRGYPTLNFLKYRVSQGDESPMDTIMGSKGSPLPKDLGLFRDKCGKKKSSAKKIPRKILVAGKIIKGIIGKIYITKKTLPLHRSGKDAMCDDKKYKRTIQKGELFQFKNVGSGFDSFSTLGDGKCSKIGYIRNEYIRDGNVRPATDAERIEGKTTSCTSDIAYTKPTTPGTKPGTKPGTGSGTGSGTKPGTTSARTTSARTTAPPTVGRLIFLYIKSPTKINKTNVTAAIKGLTDNKKMVDKKAQFDNKIVPSIEAIDLFVKTPTLANKNKAESKIKIVDVTYKSKISTRLNGEVLKAKNKAIRMLSKDLKIINNLKGNTMDWDSKGIWAQIDKKTKNYHVVKIKKNGVFSEKEITYCTVCAAASTAATNAATTSVAAPVGLGGAPLPLEGIVTIKQIKNINEPDNIIRKYMENRIEEPTDGTTKDPVVYTLKLAEKDLKLYKMPASAASNPTTVKVSDLKNVKKYMIKKLGKENMNEDGDLVGMYGATGTLITIMAKNLKEDTITRDVVGTVDGPDGKKDTITLAINKYYKKTS